MELSTAELQWHRPRHEAYLPLETTWEFSDEFIELHLRQDCPSQVIRQVRDILIFLVDIVYLNEVIVFDHCDIAHVEDWESLNLAFELTERNEEVSVHQKLVFRHSIVIAELEFLDVTAELV